MRVGRVNITKVSDDMEKDFIVHCYHCYLVQLIIYHLPVKQAADLRTLNWASG